jgi:hypothetical protein
MCLNDIYGNVVVGKHLICGLKQGDTLSSLPLPLLENVPFKSQQRVMD